ncbi:MAG: efflux RND transporter periplasmic adaptor subunit [Spirochaetaceae bacterium]
MTDRMSRISVRFVVLAIVAVVSATSFVACDLIEARHTVQNGAGDEGNGNNAGNGGGSNAVGSGDGTGGDDGGGGSGAERAPARSEDTVRVAEIETRNRFAQVAGRLEPNRRIAHETPEEGIIQDVYVNVGDPVERGDALFSLERNEIGQTFQPVTVKSRLDGIVSEIRIDVDEQVGAGASALTVVSREEYRLEAGMSDKDAAGIRPGQRVIGRTPSGTEVEGRITSRSAEPDYETGLYALEIRFPNAPRLYIGAFLVVDVPVEQVEGVFVPREALQRRYGRYYLWMVTGERGYETLERREVEPGQTVGDEIRITDGVSSGDRYIPRPTGDEEEGAPLGRSASETGEDSET